MAKVIQTLWFEKDMAAAVDFYVSLVPGSSIGWTSALPTDSPSGPAGSVTLTGFTLGGQNYLAFQAGKLDPFNHSFSISVECDDQAEVDRLWTAFLDHGGAPEQCGWLRDRWGLSWQIVPRRLGELMRGPDPAAAKRVADAMMRMVKFDIAGLEAAARGEGS